MFLTLPSQCRVPLLGVVTVAQSRCSLRHTVERCCTHPHHCPPGFLSRVDHAFSPRFKTFSGTPLLGIGPSSPACVICSSHTLVLTPACMQFFRMYLGTYDVTYPDLQVSIYPTAYLTGSRAHISPSCTSAAVAFIDAGFSMTPPGTSAFKQHCMHAHVSWLLRPHLALDTNAI